MRVAVTGGSRGIGRMLVESLKDDNEVFVISQSEKSIERVRTDLGGKVKGYVADVSDLQQVMKAFSEIGIFDALINCAGVLGPVGSLEETDMGEWERTLEVNLFGTVNCCKAATPILRRRHRGKIINLSGGGSTYPRLYHSAYAASKAAVVRFTECLAKEFEKDGLSIDVNVIAPGAHRTDMWRGESVEEEPETWDDPGRLVKLVRFLLSPKSDRISGRFISIRDEYERLDRSDSDLYTLRRIDNHKFRGVG